MATEPALFTERVPVPQLAVSTPPDSNKSLEESRCGAARCVRAEELSKMFPTPPSMEAHAQPSPTPLPDEAAPPRRNSAHSPLRDPPIEVRTNSADKLLLNVRFSN